MRSPGRATADDQSSCLFVHDVDGLPTEAEYRHVVAALAASEERFRTLVQGIRRYAIFLLDVDGRISTWNGGFHVLLGYDEDEIVGRLGSVCFTDEDLAAGLFEK